MKINKKFIRKYILLEHKKNQTFNTEYRPYCYYPGKKSKSGAVINSTAGFVFCMQSTGGGKKSQSGSTNNCWSTSRLIFCSISIYLPHYISHPDQHDEHITYV